MQFQEVGQRWSWHCQQAQPALHQNSPIPTRPSPSTALFSPGTNLTPGEDRSSDALAAHSRPRNCPVLAASFNIKAIPGLHLAPTTSQSSWLFFSTLYCLSIRHSVTVVLHPGHLSLLYIITGQAQAPSEDSSPPRQTQHLPSSCPVDGRPPPPVWSDRSRPWWSWMTRQRNQTTWRYFQYV